MLLVSALVLTATHALAATEVGTVRKLGVGAEFGNGILGVTGKYWFSPTVGVSASVGNAVLLQQLRVDFNQDLFTVRDTDFGRFDLYWLAGIDTGIWLEPGFVKGKFGLGAGLGVDLKFHDYPLDAFADVGLGAYPVDLCVDAVSLFCYLQPRANVGARYYFP